MARALTVFIATNPFQPEQPQYHPAAPAPLAPSQDTGALIAVAGRLRQCLYRPGYRYHRAEVMLLDLRPQRQQGDLLRAAPARSERLMAVLDAVNARLGRDTLRYAAEGLAQPWRMRAGHRSPAYTTRWRELPVIRA